MGLTGPRVKALLQQRNTRFVLGIVPMALLMLFYALTRDTGPSVVAGVQPAISSPGGALERGEVAPVRPNRLSPVAIDPFRTGLIPAPPPDPPVAAAPVAPSAPFVPPFPYRYFGTMKGPDGVTAVYLVRDEKLIAVQAQQMLDNDYKVESMDAAHIVVSYVPLGVKVSIATGVGSE